MRKESAQKAEVAVMGEKALASVAESQKELFGEGIPE